MSAGFLIHPLLETLGVAHGFGTKAAVEPAGVVRPHQVHGCTVARVRTGGRLHPAEADAVVVDLPGVPIGVVTADCVPVLIAREDGGVVAAIHAGWRGLAAGVVCEGVGALAAVKEQRERTRAVVGPAIGGCCYEVDDPVLDALRLRFGEELDAALAPSRSGHALLDLARLVRCDLRKAGLADERIGQFANACTRCDPDRFHSFRRSGPRAGRLLHYIEVAAGAKA